jgi:hypothetical protein
MRKTHIVHPTFQELPPREVAALQEPTDAISQDEGDELERPGGIVVVDVEVEAVEVAGVAGRVLVRRGCAGGYEFGVEIRKAVHEEKGVYGLGERVAGVPFHLVGQL